MAATPSDRQEALGQSEIFLDFQDRLSKVAPVDRPVLLLGERGTGKELAARRLHFLSRRWEGPLVTLNCATLTPTSCWAMKQNMPANCASPSMLIRHLQT